MQYNILLFLITFAGGTIPLWTKRLEDKQMHLLLAFSGSFLLCITFLHLLPETFEELNAQAGILLLAGFFLQLLIQRFTHGVEHGHVHVHPNHDEHRIPLTSILVGLSVHAFMEGLPLGFNYRMGATTPSLYMAVAAHKIPEAMLATMLVSATSSKTKALGILFLFSAITPIASILATVLGHKYYFMSHVIVVLIPVVAGAFIHISTTIFFESGTKQHLLTRQKIIAMVIGVGIGLATLIFE
jgi:zinc and cadmium transporter